MKNKFKMPLTWHNCYSCPPEEPYNNRLWATDGYVVFPVVYDIMDGWWNVESENCLPFELLYDYWWADMEQTVRGCSEFKGE